MKINTAFPPSLSSSTRQNRLVSATATSPFHASTVKVAADVNDVMKGGKITAVDDDLDDNEAHEEIVHKKLSGGLAGHADQLDGPARAGSNSSTTGDGRGGRKQSTLHSQTVDFGADDLSEFP